MTDEAGAALLPITIEQGQFFRRGPWTIKDTVTGLPLDFSGYSGDDIFAEIREGAADGNPSVHSANIGTGITLVPEIIAPTALADAFTATTTLVVTGAKFVSAGVRAGDLVTLAGTTSNDGARRVVEAVDEETLTLAGAAFVAEAAAGTYTVTNESRFEFTIDAATTDGINLVDDSGYWQLNALVAGEPDRVFEGPVTLNRNVARP